MESTVLAARALGASPILRDRGEHALQQPDALELSFSTRASSDQNSGKLPLSCTLCINRSVQG